MPASLSSTASLIGDVDKLNAFLLKQEMNYVNRQANNYQQCPSRTSVSLGNMREQDSQGINNMSGTINAANAASGQPLTAKEEEKMPLFLIKLWNIVEDPAYQEIIRWDESGYSFHIIDPYSFCRNVLPHYFKHNNLNSLIRQLNMYGFRKMTPLDRGGLTRAESDQDHLEFSHPYFVREHPELLVNIKRKASTRTTASSENNAAVQSNLNVVMDEIRSLRDKQRNMDAKMSQLVKENETLWEQVSHVRAQHHKQQQVVNKLVQFLVALVQPNGQKNRLAKRGLLAIDEPLSKRPRSSASQSSVSGGNQLTEVLDRLQRELLEGGLSGRFQNGNIGSPDSSEPGPIIAEVTDETPPQSNYNVLLQSNGNGMKIAKEQQQQYKPGPLDPSTISLSGSCQNQNRINNIPQQQRMTVPQKTQMGPLMSSTSQPCSSNIQMPQSLQQSQMEMNRYAQNTMPGPPHPLHDNTLRDPLSTPSSAMALSPSLDRQVLSTDLQEYLTGVDAGIDSCRDLIGGHWVLDDLVASNSANCRDFDFGPESWMELEDHKPTATFGMGSGGQGMDPILPRPGQLALEAGSALSPNGLQSPSNGLENNSLDGFPPQTPELLTPCTSPHHLI